MSYAMLKDYDLIGDPPGDNDYNPPTKHPHVPPGWTIQSGGGISNMHHGYYQGPYSARSTRSDVYGESLPFGQTGFDEATRGYMYDGTGVDRMQPRTDSQIGSLYQPPYSRTTDTALINYPYGPQVTYREGFNGDFELLDEPMPSPMSSPLDKASTTKTTKLKSKGSSKKVNVIWAFVLLIILFIVLDAWIQTSNVAVRKYLLKGKKMKVWHYLVLALFLTLIFWVAMVASGTTFSWFEKK